MPGMCVCGVGDACGDGVGVGDGDEVGDGDGIGLLISMPSMSSFFGAGCCFFFCVVGFGLGFGLGLPISMPGMLCPSCWPSCARIEALPVKSMAVTIKAHNFAH